MIYYLAVWKKTEGDRALFAGLNNRTCRSVFAHGACTRVEVSLREVPLNRNPIILYTHVYYKLGLAGQRRARYV